MRLFYSGADVVANPQADPRISIGGFISSTVVPNDFLGNLFDEISLNQERKGSTQTRAVFLVNETGTTVTDLDFWYEQIISVNYKASFEFAFVTAVNNESMEKIANTRSIPYSAQFVNPIGSANKVRITNSMGAGEAIGVWVKRIILPTPARSCQEIFDDYANNVTLEEQETTEVIFEWQ